MTEEIHFFDGLERLGFNKNQTITRLQINPIVQDVKLNLSIEKIQELSFQRRNESEKIAKRRVIFDPYNLNQKLRKDSETLVLRSSISGYGLFANRAFEKDEVIIEYQGQCIGELLTDLVEDVYKENGFKSTYTFTMQQTDRIIDATFIGNGARFANHSCTPNAKSVYNKHLQIIELRADKYIAPGEEIVYDYKMRMQKGSDRVPCYCGAARCRGFVDHVKG